jgi:prevent-host-death family protein
VHEHPGVHDSNAKGAIAEAEIATAAVRLGIPVLRPQIEHGRYDLVFEIAGRLVRIQCKWGSRRGEVIRVHVSGNYLSPHGYVRSPYSADQIDAVAAYCDALDQCYLLPVELISDSHQIHLRLSPPKNGQRAGLHWAADYEFAGAVAQWEERRYGIPEAGGSSPPSSTLLDSSAIGVGAHEFRNHFGWYMQRAAAGEEILITRRGKPHARLGPPREPRQARPGPQRGGPGSPVSPGRRLPRPPESPP